MTYNAQTPPSRKKKIKALLIAIVSILTAIVFIFAGILIFRESQISEDGESGLPSPEGLVQDIASAKFRAITDPESEKCQALLSDLFDENDLDNQIIMAMLTTYFENSKLSVELEHPYTFIFELETIDFRDAMEIYMDEFGYCEEDKFYIDAELLIEAMEYADTIIKLKKEITLDMDHKGRKWAIDDEAIIDEVIIDFFEIFADELVKSCNYLSQSASEYNGR